MSDSLSEKIQQYMVRVSSDFEKFEDYCVVVAYISNVNKKNPWVYKLLKKTYFKYLNIKSLSSPDFNGTELWHFAKGYCSCLLDQGISEHDLSIITFEGIKYLSENSEDIFSIYQHCIAEELQNSESDYIYDVCDQIFNLINNKIKNAETAYQFILEELEAASLGNDEAQEFVSKNAFSITEFEAAMSNSSQDVDGPDGPQQSLTRAIMHLPANMITKSKVRIIIVQKIIDYWYSSDDADHIDLDHFFNC
ncbi:hypothetical protein ACQUW1_05850 [Klebsiella pneumoniae]|jgi:hypothetical protein|uniref:hypothetical protein n=1 Tax=Enterobacteriaceae TaxID=543 RepID=UPI002005DCE1|nr:hypothetical protein [Enterobacter kobei]MCK6826092.1 hypothetical protein [Enterobacter kobei]MDZ0372526.1 hypothetical protein [Klebsiella pneumoniae]HAV2049125.1 hypothetical protein [Raoultella ornithinolytica]